MSSQDPPELDPAELLGTFIRHEVAFVAVGGFGALLLGARRATKDIDLCVEWSDENLERVASALRELDARLKVDPSYIEVPIDATLLSRMEVATWRTRCGDVDVLLGIPRSAQWDLARYGDLRERAELIELGHLVVPVAALQDIIRSKEISDRPADRDALPELLRLRDDPSPDDDRG